LVHGTSSNTGDLMRTVSNEAITAIETPRSYKMSIDATLEKSLVFFDSIMENHAAISGSPSWQDTPTLEEFGVPTSGSPGISCWINDGGTLKYQIVGDSSLISTGKSIAGKPGIYGSKIFFVETSGSSGNLNRYDIDWSAVVAKSASPLSSPETLAACTATWPMVSAVAEDGCVLFYTGASIIGGIKAVYYVKSGSWIANSTPYRFMSPSAMKYSPVRTERSLMTYVTALKFNDDVYAYVSNCGTGGVDGICWDHDTLTWGNIFIAVPADINSNLSEFRVTNSYTSGTSAFIVGQFLRRNEAEGYVPYTLVCRSTDGRNYSMGHLSMVSNLGWRFMVRVHENILWANCGNRVSYKETTYYYSGTSGSGPGAITIPDTSIKNFTDDGLQQASIDLKAGDEYYMNHPNMKAGSRMQLRMGIKTSNGMEMVPWGSYIVDGFDGGVQDGNRRITPRLVSESDWNLAGMSSPYYTEMISKSSLVDPMTDYTYMYPAENSGMVDKNFSIDFWDAQTWHGVDGTYEPDPDNINLKGGITWVRSPDAGSHGYAVRSRDLADMFGEYPIILNPELYISVWCWDYQILAQEPEDIYIYLVCEDQNTGEEYEVNPDPSSDFNYTTHMAQYDEPLIQSYLSLVPGDKLKYIAVGWGTIASTIFNIARVDIFGSIKVLHRDTNPWIVDKGRGFKLPGSGHPYIMFARKPYNAFNFIIGATFSSSADFNIGGTPDDEGNYPIGFGLVGLALDGSNYILGRYSMRDRLQIVQSVDRSETILAEVDYYAPEDTVSLMFQHQDGHFELCVLEGGIWEKKLEYDWISTTDPLIPWMFPGDIQAMHVGIYGTVVVPHFYTVGYDPGGGEETTNACAIPCTADVPLERPQPEEDGYFLEDFPASGTVVIEGNEYSYNVVNLAAPTGGKIHGPYQFRQNGDGSQGHYAPPYGTGQPGLECLDYNPNVADGYGTGLLVALDDGGVYVCTGTLQEVWITTGGVKTGIIGRTRYYGSGSMIGTSFHDLSNRVYLTGGLMNASLKKGEIAYHGFRTLVELKYSGDIYCSGFFGSSGDSDVTVRDLIDKISRLCGASAQFSGDTLQDTIVLSSGSPATLDTDNLAEGFDIHFVIDPMTNGDYVQIQSDTQIRGSSSTTSSIKILSSGSGSYRLNFMAGSTVIDAYKFSLPDLAHRTRVLYHDNFATIYMDDKWIYTFGISGVKDPDDPIHDIPGIAYSDVMGVRILTNHNGLHLHDVRVTELFDWREAVYIDLDTDGMGAISSVIQQRPIEIIVKANGAVNYAYDPIRQTVVQVPSNVREHTWTEAFPKGSASDAIVYYVDAKTVQDAEYAKRFGLSTKVFRMPDLWTGAVKAAKIAMRRMLEQYRMHTLNIRPDVRLEVGDILSVSYEASGTKTQWSVDIVAEQVSTTHNADLTNMRVIGREIIL